MADIYDSEQEQLEALRRWWKENGTTVVIGLAVGLSAVFGWTAWHNYQRGRQEAASVLFERQANAIAGQDYSAADRAGEKILEDYASSGYAAMAALLLAKSAYEEGRPSDARRHLQWVLDSDARREIKLTARLRMARLLLDTHDYAGALALLDVKTLGAFAGSFDELRADVYVAQGKTDAAREAYQRALAGLDAASPARRRVQLKLDDLGQVNVPTG